MLDDQRGPDCAESLTNGRLEQLRQQERIWFAWVCRLHDVHSGVQTGHSAAVLAIAQRRWAEARRALEREAPPGSWRPETPISASSPHYSAPR
jgi:hypothetical protein